MDFKLIAMHDALSVLHDTDVGRYNRAIEIIAEHINPLSTLGVKWQEFMIESEMGGPAGISNLQSGRASVQGVGSETTLGEASTCQTIYISLNGPAVVTISMWHPFGQMPGAIWEVNGPGVMEIQLYNNLFNIPTTCGEIVTIKAKGESGTFPVEVYYNS